MAHEFVFGSEPLVDQLEEFKVQLMGSESLPEDSEGLLGGQMYGQRYIETDRCTYRQMG